MSKFNEYLESIGKKLSLDEKIDLINKELESQNNGVYVSYLDLNRNKFILATTQPTYSQYAAAQYELDIKEIKNEIKTTDNKFIELEDAQFVDSYEDEVVYETFKLSVNLLKKVLSN